MSSPLYRRYVLGVLTLVYTLNYLDRGLIVLLLQPIKEDLHLSDTQLGLLTGIAFGLFYATLGLPIARLADRGNRVTLTSIAIGLWGATVMVCVLVTNFTQLLLARACAAIGESGCMPPTYSLVGDYFPGPAERTRAMSIYWLASPLAALISFVLGGRLSELFGWRMTFFVMGIPALVTCIIVKLTVMEPRARTGGPLAAPASRQLPPMAAVLRILWRQPATRHLTVAIVLLSTMSLGLAPWYAAFMMRSHGMTTAEVGTWLGLILGGSGAAGILLGGYVGGRWYSADYRGQMRLSALLVGSLVPFYILFLLLPGKYAAMAALMPLMMVFCFFVGPAYALLQRLVVDEMRATSVAVILLLSNLIGMGVGPQIVGMLSDLWQPRFGHDSLRYAMLTLSFVALWSAWHFWRVGRTVKDDLMALDASN
jgi:predicted MFS family arabinose efflux permease